MTKREFGEFCKNRYVILDGATGSNLQKKGMPPGVCPEKWILEHPEIMIELQRAYVEAGSDIIYAPTFTTNRVKLEEYGLYDKMEEMIRELVGLSKEAAGGQALVAGDITMTGRQLLPIGDMEFEELIEVYKEQIRYLAAAGVDLLVVETMMSLQETRAALIAAKETCGLPVMATLTFEKDGCTLFGTDGETAAIVLDRLGADAIGANCSTGPAQMGEVLRKMAVVTDKPLIGKPNAGLPQAGEGNVIKYDMDAEAFGREMQVLIDAGATILGGCCGTTPEYIQKIKELKKRNFRTNVCRKSYLTSERKTLAFQAGDPFIVVGERINPTGKKKLQEELKQGSMEMVCDFARKQEEDGALVLDVNMGMSGIDEKEMMLTALDEISMVTSLPLSLDSSHPEVLEAALRHYPGRALINSISLEKEKIEKVLPMAVKYGAMFILLPLSDKGLPENLEEKHKIIDEIVERALTLGLSKEDIVVDGLVATVGANQNAALETLETIRYCREKGLATICGLSNISFGLPERGYINAAFLTMAIQNGLTMAIANPGQELLMHAAYASDLLCHKKDADVRYITYSSQRNEIAEEKKPEKKRLERKREGKGAGTREFSDSFQEEVYQDVMKANRKGIVSHVQEALTQGALPKALLDDVLIPAINDVGTLFADGTYFLPQLIGSAETMKNAIEYLEPLLIKEGSAGDMPVVVMATVEGDIHDIGKNLVVLMLKNYGFKVIDLGKDVPKEVIVDTAIKEGAKIIGLSALMTTTMQQMRHVITYAKQRNFAGKIMIGGAVITQDFADEIGADGYSRDASEAAHLAERLLEE